MLFLKQVTGKSKGQRVIILVCNDLYYDTYVVQGTKTLFITSESIEENTNLDFIKNIDRIPVKNPVNNAGELETIYNSFQG